jgi:hypothetical protein
MFSIRGNVYRSHISGLTGKELSTRMMITSGSNLGWLQNPMRKQKNSCRQKWYLALLSNILAK